MKLFSMEQSAFAARTAARAKVNFTLNAESMRRVATPPRSSRAPGGVAVIDIHGVMLDAPDAFDELFGGFTRTRNITRQVETASLDTEVRAIVLHVNSPGGSVEGLAELGDAVASAARRKPVVAVVEGTAASAAYYAIAGATEIVAGRMDLIGSIGTILVAHDASEAFKSAGIKVVPITTGKFKATGTPGVPLTDDEQGYLQSLIDSFFADFRRTVLAGRGRVGLGEWVEIATGKVFTAGDAKRLGLIDGFATMGATLLRLHVEGHQQLRVRAERIQAERVRSAISMHDRERAERVKLQMAELCR